MNSIFPVILIVVSVTFYNICQKSTPPGANPYASLIVAYGVALAVSVLFFFFQGEGRGSWQAFGGLSWTSWVLGFTVFGIELGYLLLYRAGWDLAIGSLLINILIAGILIAVGLLLYQESLDRFQLAGIGVCVAGLILMNWNHIKTLLPPSS